jgi:predicted ATPase/class 3 adenylate cyclase
VPQLPTGTVTLLFSDIEGSTRLWGQSPDAMSRALRRHDEMVRSALEGSGGYVFKTVGDAFYATFPSAKEAVQAAGVAQVALAAERWPEEIELKVRMALHTGECEERGGDYFGPALNRVARLEAVAYGGQVVPSRATTEMVRDHLPAGLGLRELGTHRLKDLGRSEEVFQLEIEGLDGDFPPLRSLDNPELRHNLPELVSSFVGREAEVTELRQVVSESRLITLTGAGGVGKTRLALQLAAELLDGSGDGVWLVELAAVRDTEAVTGAVANVLGIKEQPGRPILDALLAALADQHVLIVLDNCEHLIGACAKLAETVVRSCPQVHLIATSRETLGIDGERVFRVPSLTVPAEGAEELSDLAASGAATLFVERARTLATGFAMTQDAAPLVAAICRHLDGVPLAIELAAARLRSMSLSHLHDRLDQRFRLLTGGNRTALPRQQTLRATVDWSYELLNSFEQAVLRRMSVFVGGFELEAAESVCGFGEIEDFDVSGLLGSLVDKSLVVADTSSTAVRYRLLETIRQYGAEKLTGFAGGGEASEAEAAHAAYYVDYAEEIAPHLTGRSQEAWLGRLEEEYPNLNAAARHLVVDADGAVQALRLFGVPRRYWWCFPHRTEIIGFLDRALETAQSDGTPRARAAALICKAYVLGQTDLIAQATSARMAAEVARQAEDRELEAEALSLVCYNAYFRGALEEGLRIGADAVAIARQLGDPVVLGQALLAYAAVVYAHDARAAETIYQEALSIVEQSGDLFTTSFLRNNYACLLLLEGRVAEARQHFEAALAITRTLVPRRTPGTLNNLGLVLLKEGDSTGATALFTDALRTSRLSGDVSAPAYSMLGLACLATIAGDLERAAILHGGANALLEAHGGAWESPEKEYRDESIATLLGHFGTDFARFYESGSTMPRDEIVDIALGRRTATSG